jgi:hypothetical protein
MGFSGSNGGFFCKSTKPFRFQYYHDFIFLMHLSNSSLGGGDMEDTLPHNSKAA